MTSAPHVFACLALSLVIGCAPAPPRPTLEVAPSPTPPSSVGRIAVLPAVDGRIDRTIEVDLQEQVRDGAVKNLRRRGYRAYASDVTGDVGAITDEDLSVADPAWVERLGPADARWVMVVVLVDVSRELTFGSTGNAEVLAYLFDREQGTLAWRDRGLGQAGQGGLLGMAFIGTMDESAINRALEDVVTSLPLRGAPATVAAYIEQAPPTPVPYKAQRQPRRRAATPSGSPRSP